MQQGQEIGIILSLIRHQLGIFVAECRGCIVAFLHHASIINAHDARALTAWFCANTVAQIHATSHTAAGEHTDNTASIRLVSRNGGLAAAVGDRGVARSHIGCNSACCVIVRTDADILEEMAVIDSCSNIDGVDKCCGAASREGTVGNGDVLQ